jgi:hypothetical protein
VYNLRAGRILFLSLYGGVGDKCSNGCGGCEGVGDDGRGGCGCQCGGEYNYYSYYYLLLLLFL